MKCHTWNLELQSTSLSLSPSPLSGDCLVLLPQLLQVGVLLGDELIVLTLRGRGGGVRLLLLLLLLLLVHGSTVVVVG